METAIVQDHRRRLKGKGRKKLLPQCRFSDVRVSKFFALEDKRFLTAHLHMLYLFAEAYCKENGMPFDLEVKSDTPLEVFNSLCVFLTSQFYVRGIYLGHSDACPGGMPDTLYVVKELNTSADAYILTISEFYKLKYRQPLLFKVFSTLIRKMPICFADDSYYHDLCLEGHLDYFFEECSDKDRKIAENQMQKYALVRRSLFENTVENPLQLLEKYHPKNEVYKKVKEFLQYSFTINFDVLYSDDISEFKDDLYDEEQLCFEDRFVMLYNDKDVYWDSINDTFQQMANHFGFREALRIGSVTRLGNGSYKTHSFRDDGDFEKALKWFDLFYEVSDQLSEFL